MWDDSVATRPEGAPAVASQAAGVRLAIVDSDTSFIRVLSKRLEAMGWQFRTLAAPVPPDELVAMRLNAVVVDLALLGPRAWEFLHRVCDKIPGLVLVICNWRSTG